MKKEQSSISIILDMAFIAIGVALLIHSFLKLLTDLNSYTIEKIIDEAIIGFIFICSRFFRNSLLGISFWVLISIGIVLYATKNFGSLGAFIALIFCITFPFWALGKYEDFQENNENTQEQRTIINYDKNNDVNILSSEKIANEVNQVDDLHMQHVAESIETKISFKLHRIDEENYVDINNPNKSIPKKNFTLVIQRGYEGVLYIDPNNGVEIFIESEEIKDFWKY